MLTNAFKVLQSRFSLVYKQLLYNFLIILILGGIGVGVLTPILAPIFRDLQVIPLLTHFRALVSAIFSGLGYNYVSYAYQTFSYSIEQVFYVLGGHVGRMGGAVTLVIVFAFLVVYITSFSHTTASDVLYQFMSANSKFGYAASVVTNIKPSLKYAGLNIIVAILHVAVIVGVALFGFYVVGLISFILVLPFTVLGIMLVNAIKSALTCRWLPEIVVGKKRVTTALWVSLKYGGKNMPKLMGGFFSVYLIMLVLHFIIALLTFGFGLLISFAFEKVLIRSLELVIYHKAEKKKFYTENQDFSPSDGVENAE